MFTPTKAAQMAAYFIQKQGGRMDVLKLVKLLYLADRESLRRYGEPISYDHPVSMPHGPVLSRILDLINGSSTPAAVAAWDEWISDLANHAVALNRRFEESDLDQLSVADLEVMESVWREFGGMDKWTLRDWTHDHCPEWHDPQGSSIPIRDEDLLQALGKSPQEAAELASRIQRERDLDRVFARL